MRRIPLTELPQTFQDAVTVARHLRINYLWVDSLCIVQDTEDLGYQISKMGHIYAGAKLVLAADCAACTSAGFLQRRTYGSQKYQHRLPDAILKGLKTVTVHHCGILHNIHRPFVAATSDARYHGLLLRRNPVFTRAWCFQERLLARKILHFTADELIWECRTFIDCECGALSHSGEGYYKTPRTEFDAALAKEIITGDPKLNTFWETIVQFYTSCKLTEPSDSLRAISGVARFLHHEKLGHYFCGSMGAHLPIKLDVVYIGS